MLMMISITVPLQVYIISGQDGSVLWQTRSQTSQMYSDLSLRTKGSHDLFLFRTIGGGLASPVNSDTSSGHGIFSGNGKRNVSCENV